MTDDALSLYFKLRPGQHADLEVVAAAALAWAEGVRAAARALDPTSDVQIRLIDAEEGSLRFNTIIEWVENTIEPALERLDRGSSRLPRTKKLAIGLAAFLIFTGPQTYDFYFGKDEFTDEDRAVLQQILEQTRNDPGVISARQKFYKVVERDPAITGLGLQEHKDDQPIAMVPSSLFAEGSGLWELEQMPDERTTYPVMEVVLVKPALVHTPRSWTFKVQGLPEFDAVMRDEAVLKAIQENGLPGNLREGFAMTVRLQIKEENIDGTWRVKRGGRSVERVLFPPIG